MGQKNSKEAKQASPNASIFPIGGGHTGDAIPEQKSPTGLQTAPEVPPAAAQGASSKAEPSSVIQPEGKQGAVLSSKAGPSREIEEPAQGE